MALLVIGSWLVTRNLTTGEKITRWQNLLEVIVATIRSQIHGITQTDATRYIPFVGTLFLFIAALSFLGLGIQPPTADWGSMVRENAGAITFGIFIPLWPAGAIAFLTVGVNLVVDWFLHIASGLKDA